VIGLCGRQPGYERDMRMAKRLNSIKEIIEFAIEREIDANKLYMYFANRIENASMRKLFEELAAEELEHKAKLETEATKREKVVAARSESEFNILDYYIVEVDPQLDVDYEDSLLLGMKKEKVSYRLYMDMASGVQDRELREMFLWLAGEEAKHKMRFEIDYDDLIEGK
jgi:rubrerythrin